MRSAWLAFLLLAMPALASNPECLGAFGERWESIDVANLRMAPGQCSSRVEVDSDFFFVSYELKEGPTKLPGKTICKWAFAADGMGRLEPGEGVPGAIICTLLH